MAWLIEKEDYKVGERYVAFMLWYFPFHLLVRAISGQRDNSFKKAADNLIDWLGMPSGFAEIVAIFVVGTLIFPPVLLIELWHLHSKRKSELRTTNGVAYAFGRLLGWILSKLKRTQR